MSTRVLIVDTQRGTAAVATKLCEVSLETQAIKAAAVSAPGRGSPSDRSAHAPQPAELTHRGQLTHPADMALPAGTRVRVGGHGCGSYAGFTDCWPGASEHTIEFDTGKTATVR